MIVHVLKTEAPYYEAVATEEKTFEVRFNDRNFKVGDYLLLRDFDAASKTLLHRKLVRRVSYVLTHEQFHGVSPGFAVLGLALTTHEEDVKVFKFARGNGGMS